MCPRQYVSRVLVHIMYLHAYKTHSTHEYVHKHSALSLGGRHWPYSLRNEVGTAAIDRLPLACTSLVCCHGVPETGSAAQFPSAAWSPEHNGSDMPRHIASVRLAPLILP